MHGNPDWSFLYRNMIPLLSQTFRCVAMDYPGFGLSVHPDGYGYLPSEHGAIVTELVDHLDLQNAILMGQDWGGPIGMDVASRSPERFTALIMGNTFFFPSTFPVMRMFSRVLGTTFMQKQIVRRNLFVNRIMKWALQEPINDAEFAHYIDVAPTPESRIGHAVFPKAIIGEERWLAELERRVDATLLDRPMLLTMGLKDKPMTTKAFLAKWTEKFPDATRVDLPKAGHYFQEDAPEEVVAAILEKYGPS